MALRPSQGLQANYESMTDDSLDKLLANKAKYVKAFLPYVKPPAPTHKSPTQSHVKFVPINKWSWR
jgi:hypothetical protein